MKLPVVNRSIVDSTTINMEDEESVYRRICKNNPVIAEYLTRVGYKLGEQAALIGLLVYRFLESQLEAEAML